MMIVNYHGFFRVHRHHCANPAAHRSNCANHRDEAAGHCDD